MLCELPGRGTPEYRWTEQVHRGDKRWEYVATPVGMQGGQSTGDEATAQASTCPCWHVTQGQRTAPTACGSVERGSRRLATPVEAQQAKQVEVADAGGASGALGPAKPAAERGDLQRER